MKKTKANDDYIIVTRSDFCKKCWQADRPQKRDKFILFGTSNQQFKARIAHNDGRIGYTPHLYTFKKPYELNEEGLVVAVKTCLMNGCGISIGGVMENGNYAIDFNDSTDVYLTKEDADALIDKWKNTGYELL